MPRLFEDLLDEKLPSFMEASEESEDDEKEEEKDTSNKDEKDGDSMRQSIVDKIEKADVKIAKKVIDDFIAGEINEIEAKEDDYDALTDAFDKVDEVDVEKDDDVVKVIFNESVESFLNNAFSFMESDDESYDSEEEADDDFSDNNMEESDVHNLPDEIVPDDGVENLPDEISSDDAEEEGCNGCGTESEDFDGFDDDDFDGFDDDDDADEFDDVLDQLENETDDEPLDDEPSTVDEPELDNVEDKKADDMLAMVATPMLLKDELTAEESVNFYESADAEIAVEEGLIEESSLDDLFQEGVFASPNKPFKMTKKARMNQLYELSVQIEARAHRDPMMKKLDRAYAIERGIKKKLRAKYHAPALKRAKGYLMRLMKSKSGVMKNLAKKILPSK